MKSTWTLTKAERSTEREREKKTVVKKTVRDCRWSGASFQRFANELEKGG